MLDPRELANIQVMIMLSLTLVPRVETDEEPGYEWTILTALVVRKSIPVGPPRTDRIHIRVSYQAAWLPSTSEQNEKTIERDKWR